MRRSYWEGEHGGTDELRTYGESSASRAFGWLKKRGFLAPVGNLWDPVDIPLHIHGRTHAFELKLARGEWDTALEQASRADCFADYRWVVYDADTADRALANAERFHSEGVGLITVHPDRGVEIEVWAEQCTPELDREMLDRYNVERWDLNERVLKHLNFVEMRIREYDDSPEQYHVSDLLHLTDPEDVGVDPDPPTVHGYTAGSSPEDTPETRGGSDHKPLTAFAGDGDE